MESFTSDVRISVRALRRRPATSAAIVATLALGIGANTAVFSVVQRVLLRSLPYPDPDRLVRIWESGPRGGQRNVAEANFVDWRSGARSFEALALYINQTTSLSGGQEPVRAQAAIVSRGFFEVMRVAPLFGRPLEDGDGHPEAVPVAVVGHGFWQRVLGGERDLSRVQLRFGNASHAVVGVMPAGFSFPTGAEVWSAREIRFPFNPSRSSHNFGAVGRLGAGVTPAAAQVEITSFIRRAREEFGEQQVDSLSAMVLPLRDDLIGPVRPALLVLMGAVGLLLLVACANVANLTIAEAQSRLPELAVRSALGASRLRLFRQFFAEALLLSAAGGTLGVLVAAGTLGALVRMAETRLPRAEEIGIDGSVLLFSAALSIVTALLAGVLPALRLDDADAREVLKGGGRSHSEGKKTRSARAALAVSQLALTLTLLVGAGLLARSFSSLLQADLGFERGGRLVADVVLPPLEGEAGRNRLASFHARFEERIRALPGVTASGGVSHLPLLGREANGWITLDSGVDRSYSPSYRAATPGYFAAMGIPLRRGRLLEDRDGPAATPVAVISQTAAQRVFGSRDPIGRRFEWGNMDGAFDTWVTIVGVVADVRHQGAQSRVNGEIYLHALQRPHRTATFSHVIQVGGDPRRLAPAVRDAARALDPEVTVQTRLLEDVYAAYLADKKFSVSLLGTFAVTALGLALLGLYSVMIYTVTSRTQEIGIRMALGAAPGDVVQLLLGDASKLTAAGLGLGIAGALVIGRLLESLLHGVGILDPATFAGVVSFLGTSALAAAWLPARRASRVDPIVTLQGLQAAAPRAAETPERDAASIERRARDLLAEVAQESRGARNGEEVLELACGLVKDALGARTLALFMREADGAFRCLGRPELVLDRTAFVARRLRRLNAPLSLRAADLDAWQGALREEGFHRPAERQSEIETLRALDAALVAPVALRGDFLGLLVAGPRADGKPYRKGDDELTMAVAAQLALVLENAQLLSRIARQERIERDLQMAALVQARLLPGAPPRVAGLDIHGFCLAARGVAGDYFDFVVRSDGSLALTVADVAGKGMPAALLTSGLRAAVRGAARLATSTPADVVRAANDALVDSGDGASYATIFQSLFAPGGRQLTYTNAGHNPPLLFRADGRVEALAAGGTVAGLFAEAAFDVHAVALQSGDALVAYTDGLAEAASPEDEEYGTDRLASVVRRAGALQAKPLAERIAADVRSHTRGAPQGDDLTLVVVRVL